MDSSVIIAWVLAHLNYWVVALFMAIESSFIPFPSEVVVPPAAWKAMTDPDMNIVGVVISATLGADIGALINYYLARWLGRPLVYRFARSRFGRRSRRKEGGRFLPPPRKGVDLLRALGAGRAPIDQHSGRLSRNEAAPLPALHDFRCGGLEYDLGHHRMGHLSLHGPQNAGGCRYFGHEIQSRNWLRTTNGCRSHRLFPRLQRLEEDA